jgi:hypothetical protein
VFGKERGWGKKGIEIEKCRERNREGNATDSELAPNPWLL